MPVQTRQMPWFLWDCPSVTSSCKHVWNFRLCSLFLSHFITPPHHGHMCIIRWQMCIVLDGNFAMYVWYATQSCPLCQLSYGASTIAHNCLHITTHDSDLNMEVPVTSQYQDTVSVATRKFASSTQHFLALPSASEVDPHSIWKLNSNSPISTTKSTICSRANRQDARQFVSQVTTTVNGDATPNLMMVYVSSSCHRGMLT